MRLLAVLLVVALLPLAAALPTPGFNGAASQQTLGRIFPEALQTNDYVSFEEAVAGLGLVEAQAPDRVAFVPIGESTGWVSARSGQREPTPMFAVEVTDEASAAPKATLVFFLSIHGNEKGGREGGLRVIEDLALGIGLAAEEPDLVDLLGTQKLVFIFANSDGWTHEEPEYKAADPASTDQFTRGNANRLDLNRQFPTTGYMDPDHTPLSESESRAMVAYTRSLTNVVAGADIHGMLQNSNLVRLLLKDGEKTQAALYENELLAELYKERLNANPAYDAWEQLFDAPGVCCGEVAQWAATFDAIGYSASGTAGAWIVQQHALDAPGYTVEFAYNHMLMDSYYPGPGAQLNAFHVEAVRDNVAVFMRFAAEPRDVRIDAGGRATTVLRTPAAATDADDDKAAYEGWFVQSEADDADDILHKGYDVSPNAYFEQLAQATGGAVRLADAAALDGHTGDNLVVLGAAARAVDPAALRAYAEAGGNVVLTDDALPLLVAMGLVPEGSVAMKEAYSGYADLVDREHPLAAGLKGFPRQTYDPNPLGFEPGTSPVWFVDRASWEDAGGVTVGAVAKKGSGAPVVDRPEECDALTPRVPLFLQRADHDHFGESSGAADLTPPVHLTTAARASAFGVGADCEELDAATLGVLKVGAGTVHVFGAILPPATEAYHHPYGLDDHAVAIAGNHILLRMLGMEHAVTARDAGEAVGPTAAPMDAKVGLVSPALLLMGVAAAGLLLRRRPSP